MTDTTDDLQVDATATTGGAQAHARSQAGQRVESMPTVPATAAADLPASVDASSVVWEETVAGGGYAHRVLARGTTMRLVDLRGEACANLALWSALDPWERLNVADTVKVQWQAYLGPGALFLSDQGRALATITADSSQCHDTLCGSSSILTNETRYGDGSAQGPSPSARALFALALTKQGLTLRDLPPTISLFKGARIETDGATTFRPGTGPGAEVTITAEMPLIVAIANVPHVLDPRPDYVVTPLRITAWRDRATGPDDAQWTGSPERERAYLNTAEMLDARGAR